MEPFVSIRPAADTRPTRWTRTATARWLNERAEATNAACLRMRGVEILQPRGFGNSTRFLPKQPGYILQIKFPGLFDRIHARLLALGVDTARETAPVPEIVRW